MQQHFHNSSNIQAQEAHNTMKVKYPYNPQELVYTFFEKVLKDWPGYRISNYQFLDGDFIEITLSR